MNIAIARKEIEKTHRDIALLPGKDQLPKKRDCFEEKKINIAADLGIYDLCILIMTL